MAYRREIKDNGYKSVFTNSWLVRQRSMSWIKGLGKNPQQKTCSLLALPFVRGYRIVTPWTPRNDCVYTSQAHDGAQWQGSRQNTQKSECAFRRSSSRPFQNNMRVFTASDASWLIFYKWVLVLREWIWNIWMLFHYEREQNSDIVSVCRNTMCLSPLSRIWGRVLKRTLSHNSYLDRRY